MIVSKIMLLFMRKKKTWDYYFYARKVMFSIHKFIYNITDAANEKRGNASAGIALIKLSFLSLTIPALVSFFLYFSESYFTRLFNGYSIKVDGGGNYGTLLGVITSVSGVFIGLYFSSMVAITGVIYANIDDKIRRVLINDRLSNFYLRYLSLFTVFGVIQLCLNCLGMKPNPLTIILILVGSAVATMSFIPLGKRMFELFDPSRLSLLIIERLNKSIRNVSAGNSLWYEESFQAHEYKIAKKNVLILVQLAELIGVNQVINGQRFVGVATELVRFLYGYRLVKNKIPTNSMWFEDIFEYEKLFFIPGFKLDVRFATATLADPQSRKDYGWLERLCFSIITNCLTTNIENKRYDDISGSIVAIGNYFEQSSFDGDVDLSINFMTDVFSIFSDSEKIKEWGLDNSKLAREIGVWDHVSTLPIVLLLSYFKFIKKLDFTAVNSLVDSINWFDKKSIYMCQFSQETLKYLESVRCKIILERDVEGGSITSSRQVAEDIIKIELSRVKGEVEKIINILIMFYDKYFWFAAENNLNEITHVIFSKREEFISKVINNIDDVGGDIEPNNDFVGLDSWFKKQELSKVKMLVEMHSRSNVRVDPSIPDYNGYRCHWIANELFNGFLRNDNEVIKSLYSCAFKESFMQFSMLYGDKEISRCIESDKITFSIPPLANLIAVTGAGIILSDFFGNHEIRNVINNQWMEYINGEPQKIDFIYALGGVLNDGMVINMESLRFRWERLVMDVLVDVPVEYSRNESYLLPEEVYMHSSALVRIFAEKNYMSMHKMWDVFYTEIIMTSEYADETKCSSNVKSLLHSIKHEVKKYDGYMSHEASHD